MKIMSPVFALTLLVSAQPVIPATMNFDFKGLCVEGNCDAAGMQLGGMFSGRLELDTSSFAPYQTIDREAIVDFQYNFAGDSISKTKVAAWDRSGVWGATSDRFVLDLWAGNSLDPEVPALTIMWGNLTNLMSETSNFLFPSAFQVTDKGWCDQKFYGCGPKASDTARYATMAVCAPKNPSTSAAVLPRSD